MNRNFTLSSESTRSKRIILRLCEFLLTLFVTTGMAHAQVPAAAAPPARGVAGGPAAAATVSSTTTRVRVADGPGCACPASPGPAAAAIRRSVS
jgi:hypothetical protein